MAQNDNINLPGAFGGLMHYNEEYDSFWMMKPTSVIVFIILILGLRILLPFIFK